MEDSGIDSGDHNGDIREQQDKNALFIRTANSDTSSSAESGGRSPSRIYTTPPTILSPLPPPPQSTAPPTSRQLHRKLEARIENARRLHKQQELQKQQQQEDNSRSTKHGGGRKDSMAKNESGGEGGGGSTGPGLLPLQRLNIPRAVHVGGSSMQSGGGCKDQQQPLVQWEDSDDSEEDIINFFPLSRKESKAHQEISDTFSIEELSISGDEDEEDLHLVPPTTIYRTVTCCPFACTLL